ncbi:MAG: glycoside hydrolase family 16 protein [Bacteroidia bacterium]|nr:glycoside hydrolase family 16 protein [Bacteroidia bacterium]
MKIFLAFLILFYVIAGWGQSLPAENFGDKKEEWSLVWEDQFDVPGLPDSKIWDYEEGYVRNHEAQYYTRARAENARIDNGCLIIEARKDDWNGNPITSASLNTYGKKSILYGRIEVRAKLTTGRGTWPAIWMLGENIRKGGWPACGEIDIMENVGFDPDIIHVNIHTKAYNHVKGTNKGNKISIENPSGDFHIYAIEWFDDHIDFFVDDSLYFSFKNEHTGFETWPFDKPHYLLINLAIGGSWGGQKGIDESIFPQKYYIDYVKVFQEKK